MGGGMMGDCEQQVAKDNLLRIVALYKTKSLHEERGFGVHCLRSMTQVPELGGKG